MKSQLDLSKEYKFIEHAGIWQKKNAPLFQYSDGDKLEEQLGNILINVSDKSVYSDELKSLQVDWPTVYYFSANRINLLRPLEKKLLSGARVLELGCGMGAITRYLGETAKEVIAVEGSARRGSIAAIRCADLDNVQILVDEIKSLPSSLGKFDVVTLIGVLEYSRRYGGPGAEKEVLRKARSFLKEDGFLILAIENKLGLKYFAGIPEDHIPRHWLGITNGYRENGVCTWSRKELLDMLDECGFSHCEQFIPLTDYKLPTSIITPQGLAEDGNNFDLGPILNNTIRLLEPLPLFNIGEAWQSIRAAGLLKDMANSLCFVATAKSKAGSPFEDGVLVHHYGDQSSLPKKYSKEVRIEKTGDKIQVTRQKLEPGKASIGPFAQVVENEPYYPGELLYSKLRKIVMAPDWTLEEFFKALEPWTKALLEKTDPEGKCEGNLLDFAPFNIILTDQGVQAFDLEWVAKKRIPVSWILQRGLFHTLLRLFPLRKSSKHEVSTFNEIFQQFMKTLKLPAEWPQAPEYLWWQEAKFYRFIKNSSTYQPPKDMNIIYGAG